MSLPALPEKVTLSCERKSTDARLVWSLTMIRRILVWGGISIAITRAKTSQRPAAPANGTPRKRGGGEPDWRGMCPINHLIGVPRERTRQYGDRLYMTDEEFAKAQKSVEAR